MLKAITGARKQIAIPLMGLCLLMLLTGCKAGSQDQRPLIVTSIYPYQLLIQELVGDSIQVRGLIPANASPHSWSAKPADLKSLDDARLLVMNGLGLEAELTHAFEERGAKLVNISKLLKLDMEEPHEEDEQQHAEAEAGHDHAHTGLNPHIWLSPQLLLRATIMLSDELQTRFPDRAAAIGRNTTRLMSDLAALHQQITSERAALNSPYLITYHDSFHWFAGDYDIEVSGTVQSSPGKEPTAKELALLGALIKTKHIKAIFVEPQMDKRSAKVLADEFELAILELDPLGHSLKPTRIIDLIWSNWERMKLAWDQGSKAGRP